MYNSIADALCNFVHDIAENQDSRQVENGIMIKAVGFNTESKPQMSAESKLPFAVRMRPHCANSYVLSCDAELVSGLEDRLLEGCDSHLLIVTSRGWTPARKEAIISLRHFYCQNFNTAAQSVLQGQIKKSRSELRHTEECVLGYSLD